MHWRKLGMVFRGAGQYPWMASHAANPVAESRGGDVYRVYFSCRDRDNRSHVVLWPAPEESQRALVALVLGLLAIFGLFSVSGLIGIGNLRRSIR